MFTFLILGCVIGICERIIFREKVITIEDKISAQRECVDLAGRIEPSVASIGITIAEAVNSCLISSLNDTLLILGAAEVPE